MSYVSIGLPVYNGERYLGAAIDSILQQTFVDFELIISDNASTDATEAICRTYAEQDTRIRYIRNEQNKGGAWNFNHVFALASGKYFRWHCYDDLCGPELLQCCVTLLDTRPEVILCYPQTVIIDEHGQTLRRYNDNLYLQSSSRVQRSKQFFEQYRFGAACNVHYGLMRSEVLRQTHLIAPFVDSDIVMIGELALRGQFAAIPKPLFFRRDHPDVTIRALPTARERLAWFDPSRKGRRTFPIWKMWWEYLMTVGRVPMSGSEKLRCYLLVMEWFCWQVKAYSERRLEHVLQTKEV